MFLKELVNRTDLQKHLKWLQNAFMPSRVMPLAQKFAFADKKVSIETSVLLIWVTKSI